MAEKRMFSKPIIDSDSFLDMPLSTQALYFHLSMRADDDGFVNNAKRIQRLIGASDDDFKVLITKSYIICFETGVMVIRHWRIHNYIRKDRKQDTKYQEEMALLQVKENGAYALANERCQSIDGQVSTECQAYDGQMSVSCHTENRLDIDKIRLDKNRNEVICAEVNSAPVAEITLVDGTKHFITEGDYEKDRKAFPAVDVKQEYLKMERWGDANPKKRKTRNGIKRFINSWLEREQNRGGSADGGKEAKGADDRRNNRSRDEEDGPLTHYTLTEHFVGER